MEALFGPTLKGKTGDIATSTALAGKVVGIYFSAHWCPPCRGFTPSLCESYTKMTSGGKNLEIVFVSSDNDESSFDEYYGEMPFLALPYADRDRKAALSKKFGCKGIPMLVFIDENGKTITKDGRSAVSSDPTGEDFPWTPKTVTELLGPSLRGADGSTVPLSALAGKNLALYFSAHWCPPCRGFTPKLKELYDSMKASGKDDFEFIFVSSDRDEGAFNEYHGEMPWMALPFEKRKEKEALSSMFEVQGIPTLITLDPDGKVINKNARGAASAEDAATTFPWVPKPFEELSATVESQGYDVNEKPAFIVLCDGCDAQTKSAVRLAVESAASDHLASTKGNEEGPDVIFFVASENQGPVPQVKKLCGQPDAPAATPTFLLLDIPDNGGYYSSAPSAATAETIGSFLRDYSAKSLTREQMQRG